MSFEDEVRGAIDGGDYIYKASNGCPSRERRSTFAAGTALHVLGMPRHCTGFILGVSVTHPWPASPCSALIPEMLVGSDGTSQRLRTRISLQEARHHHVLSTGL